ncbi:phage tail assembly protein T [Burkholderia perseverans]|uniref:phage tail assembly protein T n=1 Tax=Burkholderia perseverans TaxID=2615214 RepID=UPI003CC7E543
MIALALRLGRTPGELERTLTAREFVELQAYDEGSPIDDRRADFHAAMIASAVYRAAGAARATVADCMPTWGFAEDQPADGTATFKAFLQSQVEK